MYKLEAVLGDRVETIHLKSFEDSEAIGDAIHVILDEAYEDKTGPWAMGAITLTSPDGEIIQTMDAK